MLGIFRHVQLLQEDTFNELPRSKAARFQELFTAGRPEMKVGP